MDGLICFAHEKCILSAFVLQNRFNLARDGAVLFLVTMAVVMNFNPLNSNLISLSVKFVLDRFFINLSLFFVREEVDSFLQSLRFLVFICVCHF